MLLRELHNVAVATVAKSVFRQNDNIVVGYGEVPSIHYRGVVGWGLPGGEVTFREEEAIEWATKLDAVIRANMKSVQDIERSNRAA